jgi:predicted TIM-barrel fold metal-dependent hydrolase
MTPPIPFFSQDGQWDFPDDVAGLYSNENVLLEVCYPISWGGRMDYPYPELQELIRGLRNVFGAEKLVWGSDMPNVERFCTYKQSLDYVRNYCSFLSADEMDKMLGRNIATVLNISAD